LPKTCDELEANLSFRDGEFLATKFIEPGDEMVLLEAADVKMSETPPPIFAQKSETNQSAIQLLIASQMKRKKIAAGRGGAAAKRSCVDYEGKGGFRG
jgi:hypothetical protein